MTKTGLSPKKYLIGRPLVRYFGVRATSAPCFFRRRDGRRGRGLSAAKEAHVRAAITCYNEAAIVTQIPKKKFLTASVLSAMA